MQHYQYFWHQSFTHNKISELLVDYDTFIQNFSAEIYRSSSIILTDIQKQYIKSMIDPENQNQVYKSAFLIFVRDFWSLPSNRTKLFNMKLNLSLIKFKQALEMAGKIKIKLLYPYTNGQIDAKISSITSQQYLIQKDKLKLCSATNSPYSQYINKQKMLLNKGFITIGSDQKCDIIIENNFVNAQHIKIIYATNLVQQRQSTPSFPVAPVPKNRVFIRDISKSNRIREVLNTENKMVALKKGMTIANIGLIQGLYEIKIDSLPEGTESELKQIENSLNADRVSYIQGQPDKPIQKIISYNFNEVTQSTIADLYDRNLFYPEVSKIKTSKSQQKNELPPLKLTIKNKRTLQQFSYNSKSNKKLIIGRSTSLCDIIIDDISIRASQIIFEKINDIWFLRYLQDTQIFLTTNGSQATRNSNRMEMIADYRNKFVIKNNISVEIQIISKDQIPGDDNYY